MDALQTSLQEDWLLESLEKYEGIYMYELQYPSACLEWSEHGSSVWLAAMAGDNNSEILQLALPEHLLPLERQTLWAKRDFKLVNGAFVKSRITALKYISSECVLSASTSGQAQVWAQDKDKADLLQVVDTIDLKLAPPSSTLLQDVSPSPSPSPAPPTVAPAPPSPLLDVSSAPPTLLLAGTTSDANSLQVHDFSSKKTLFQLAPNQEKPRPLHSLAFLECPHSFVSCSGKGQVDIWDLRKDIPTQPVTSIGPPTPRDASAVSSSEACYSLACSDHAYPDCHLAVLASSGTLELYDCRQPHCPQASCRWGKDSTPLSSHFVGSQGHQVHSPCVKYCPVSPHTISVSGVGKGVRIYDTSNWSCNMSEPCAVFTHGGHEAESPEARVLVHSWQPGVEGKTILSADSLANLHAWQPGTSTHTS